MNTALQLSLIAPPHSRVPRTGAVRRLSAIVACGMLGLGLTSCAGGLPMPTSESNTGQMLLDVNNAPIQMREDNAFMQAQIDSLRGAVAYQDTIIHQLAALANVSVRPLSSSFP